jgi:hypothetical protein
LPIRAGRRAVTVVTATTLAVALIVPGAVIAREPKGLDRFMHAFGEVESGGDYTARNSTTHTYGKYQILPANWKTWARLYLGNAKAKPTARNQERVARAKFKALYRWLGAWRFVAHWWLTGSSSKHVSDWSTSSRRYVQKVMKLYGHPMSGRRTLRRTLQESSRLIRYRGGWSTARHGSYLGDRVRYATRSGARATVTFSGRSIAWVGPIGPTRGRARVYVDGRYVRTVSLRSRSFDARATLFSRSWSKRGRHTLTIVVAGRGGPVAIDAVQIR